jgi:hypothetical protein
MRYILLILLLASCATDKSATKYFDKHSDKGSGYCASKYPVKVGDVKVSEQDWSDTVDYCPTCLTGTFRGAVNNSVSQDGVLNYTPKGIDNMPILNKGLFGDNMPSINDNIPTRIINHYHVERDSIPYIDSAALHNVRLQLGNALQTNAALQNTIIANNKAANAIFRH